MLLTSVLTKSIKTYNALDPNLQMKSASLLNTQFKNRNVIANPRLYTDIDERNKIYLRERNNLFRTPGKKEYYLRLCQMHL